MATETSRSRSIGCSLRKMCYTVMLLPLLFSCSTLAFSSISPSMHPEDVVRKQLDAFKESDIKTAFEYASPENQIVTGPLKEFEFMLRSEQAFRPIIAHYKADILMTVCHEDWGMCCLVRLVPKIRQSKPCLEYWWELTKQQDGAKAGCWMIDSVLPDFEDMSLSADDMFEDEDDDIFYDAMDLFDE